MFIAVVDGADPHGFVVRPDDVIRRAAPRYGREHVEGIAGVAASQSFSLITRLTVAVVPEAWLSPIGVPDEPEWRPFIAHLPLPRIGEFDLIQGAPFLGPCERLGGGKATGAVVARLVTFGDHQEPAFGGAS